MSTEQDAYELANKMLDEGYPKSWVWDEDGDRIIGTLVGIDIGQTKDYGPKPILLISLSPQHHNVPEGREEVRTVWIMHTVLANEVKEKNPQIGEVIGIQRGEEQVGANNMKYRKFLVKIPTRMNKALTFNQAVAALGPGGGYVDGEVVEPEPVRAEGTTWR